jgi:hypothetical protein
MEQFDTIIVYFGGLNRCQWHVSLSTTGIWLSLSPLLTKDKKMIKIKFCTKIELEKYQWIKIV